VQNNISISEMKKKECYSFHDFMVGRDYNVKPTPIISAAETMYAFDMVIQATQSTAVMIIGSTSTSATLAVVTAALLRNLPVININIDENVLDVTISKAITTMSTCTISISSYAMIYSSHVNQIHDCLDVVYR